jgi:hypothetical protein
MIDEMWLSRLKFNALQNIIVEGYAGIGSNNVALNALMADGKKGIIRLPKTTLAFHIREAPPRLCAKPEYQIEEVNEKLKLLVGHPMFDVMSLYLNDLCCKVIHIVAEHGLEAFLFSNLTAESVDTLPFILHSPGIERRIKEFAEWPYDPDDRLANMPLVNGEDYQLHLFIGEDFRSGWVSKCTDALKLPEWDKQLDASSFHHNPLIVWGAAATEGFFTDDEMPRVAGYLHDIYGSFVENRDVIKLLGQANAAANLLAQYVPKCNVERFVRLCAACGLAFQAVNLKNDVVADGLKMIGNSST